MAFVRVERLDLGTKRLCLLLGKPLVIGRHWVQDRSLPCQPGCPYCFEQSSKIRCFFPAFMKHQDWLSGDVQDGPVVVELAYDSCLDFIDSSYPFWVWLQRGKKERSPVWVKPLQQKFPLPSPCPSAFDVCPTLRRWPGWMHFDKPFVRIAQ